MSPMLGRDAGELESAVRQQVRERGWDPMAKREDVRQLAVQLAAVLDRDADEADAAGNALAGFGPLQPYFDDPEVEEIWVNGPGEVFVARAGRSELTSTILSPDELSGLIERMLRASGRRVDTSSPFVDALLSDGSRLHVVIPDITRAHPAVNIRKFVMRPRDVSDLVSCGTLTADAAAFLEASVVAGLNIIVAGATQAGKTTLLNSLLGCIPGHERVITCEEVFELRPPVADWVAMQTRDGGLDGGGEITLRRLVRESLRMRPSRLVIGEVRGAESLDALIAMNSGLPAMGTVHANSARDAVTKLCALPLLAGANVPAEFVIPTVASCVDLIVHTGCEPDGRRRVREIAALSGRVEGQVIEMSDLFHLEGGSLVRGGGHAPHPERFSRAGLDLGAVLAPPRSRGSHHGVVA